jgi:hypothetical protein
VRCLLQGTYFVRLYAKNSGSRNQGGQLTQTPGVLICTLTSLCGPREFMHKCNVSESWVSVVLGRYGATGGGPKSPRGVVFILFLLGSVF